MSQTQPWRSVLAVVAHPDDESFGLGAVATEAVGADELLRRLHSGDAVVLDGQAAPWAGAPMTSREVSGAARGTGPPQRSPRRRGPNDGP